MIKHTQRTKSGLIAIALLLSGIGVTAATAPPAAAADICGTAVKRLDDGKKIKATNNCSDKTLKRKFVWNDGPDSMCTTFRPGQSYTHSRPLPWSTFYRMAAC